MQGRRPHGSAAQDVADGLGLTEDLEVVPVGRTGRAHLHQVYAQVQDGASGSIAHVSTMNGEMRVPEKRKLSAL